MVTSMSSLFAFQGAVSLNHYVSVLIKEAFLLLASNSPGSFQNCTILSFSTVSEGGGGQQSRILLITALKTVHKWH